MISEEQMDRRVKELYRKMPSKRADMLLSVLGKNKSFLNALDTSVGQEILKDVVTEIQNKIELILHEKQTDKDCAELRAYRTILTKWQTRLAKYNKDQETFKKKSV